MKRISLRQLVVVTPLLAAIGIAWWFAGVRNERLSAIEVFDRCVERNEALDLGWTIEEIGKEGTIRRIKEAAERNTNIVFDGGVRFAQRLPQNHDNGRGAADGYSLFGMDSSVRTSVWNGPAGTRISSIMFRDDQLIISIYGDLQMGAFSCSIPKTAPEEYAVPWPAYAPDPPDHDLKAMILARHPESVPQATSGG